MSIFLRKAFRFGPVRLNLSKTGFGLSAGVKGARLGIGPRGRYVHAGRHGLYYRKQLSSGKSTATPAAAPDKGCATAVLTLLAIVGGGILLMLLLGNPVLLGLVLLGGAVATVAYGVTHWQRRKWVRDYKNGLDRELVAPSTPPTPETITMLRQQRQRVAGSRDIRKELLVIETDVYEAVLDQILDNGYISEIEAARIAAAEKVLGLDESRRLKTKKDIFSAAYVEAIGDQRITQQQLDHLHNLAQGLALPAAELEREFEVIREIQAAQILKPPFDPLPAKDLQVKVQKSEDVYLQAPAQVLSQRKSRESATGYEYTVRREGTLVLTQKRILIAGGGNTIVGYDDIDDMDVDIDQGFIEITKTTSGRPTIIKTARPLYTARLTELLKDEA